MKNIIPKFYKSYGDYVNKRKMIVSRQDGLIPVQRRLLLTLHLVAKTSMVKTNKILGDMLAKFHPHETADGTAEWCVQNKLAVGDGQWGTARGIEPINAAASRYTSLKASPFIEEIAFKYVDSVVWEEDEVDPEPVTLPTMIPICFLSETDMSTIAFGFRPTLPTYKFGDLVSRLLYLLDNNNPKKIIKPNVYNCDITSKPKAIEKILTTAGKHTIDVVGKYKVDEANLAVHVYGWAPRDNMRGTSFKTILDRINKYQNSNLIASEKIGFVDESTSETDIKFVVLQKRNSKEVFDLMVKAIEHSLKFSIGYKIITIDENKNIIEDTVDSMLLSAFNNYKKAMEIHIRNEIKSLIEKIKELEALELIKTHIKDVLNLTSDLDTIAKTLAEKTKLTLETVNMIIDKYKIKHLLKDMKIDKNSLVSEKTKLESQLSDTQKTAIDFYKEVYKKYA